jgi:hypothetical protein
MNKINSSYTFYLTRSVDAAHLLSLGMAARRKEGDGIISTGSGPVNQDCRIPAIYHDRGFYYAYTEYEAGDIPEYKIICC